MQKKNQEGTVPQKPGEKEVFFEGAGGQRYQNVMKTDSIRKEIWAWYTHLQVFSTQKVFKATGTKETT